MPLESEFYDIVLSEYYFRLQVAQFLVENERLLVVAASTMIMSISHTALRPVLPVFAKVGTISAYFSCSIPFKLGFSTSLIAFTHKHLFRSLEGECVHTPSVRHSARMLPVSQSQIQFIGSCDVEGSEVSGYLALVGLWGGRCSRGNNNLSLRFCSLAYERAGRHPWRSAWQKASPCVGPCNYCLR